MTGDGVRSRPLAVNLPANLPLMDGLRGSRRVARVLAIAAALLAVALAYEGLRAFGQGGRTKGVDVPPHGPGVVQKHAL